MQKGIPNRIHEVLKNPDKYLNKNVLVSGVIDDVCPMRDVGFRYLIKTKLVRYVLK